MVNGEQHQGLLAWRQMGNPYKGNPFKILWLDHHRGKQVWLYHR